MVQLCLYRVFREALGNVEKHAYAEQVEVTLLGLVGMRERLDMLGGRLEISSIPGRGTKVVAMLPGLDYWRSAPPPVARVDEPWRGF